MTKEMKLPPAVEMKSPPPAAADSGGFFFGEEEKWFQRDGTGISSKFKNGNWWSECKTTTVARSGFFEPDNLKDPKDFGERDFGENRGIRRIQIVTQRFVFDSTTITALRAKARPPGSPNNDHRQPTKVVMVISALWKAIICAAQANHQGNPRSSVISLGVNLRDRMAVPTSENACGNFYVGIPTRFTAKENEIELHHLVGLIQETFRKTLSVCSKLSNPDDIFSMVVDFLNEERKSSLDEKVEMHHFTSWCRFPSYGIDFGWGKPYLVSSACMPAELVILLDTKCVGLELKRG
ncbi:hypothetical protein U1Q18_036748 [Sarracenia purpurea var. burkii]